MPEFVFILISGLLPLVLIIVMIVLLKRIADGIDRIEATVDRHLLRLRQTLEPGDEAEGRWPTEE